MKFNSILLGIILVLVCSEIVSANGSQFSNTLQASIDTTAFVEKFDAAPEPVGGIESIMKKIQYPESAKQAKVEGKVYVKLFIDEKGNVAEAKIAKGVSADLNDAAIKAVKGVKFKPAKKNGQPVKVKVVLPIVFKLS